MFIDVTKRPLTAGLSFVLLISVFFVDVQSVPTRPAIRTTTARPNRGVSDEDLKSISATLFELDDEGLYGYPDLNIQSKNNRENRDSAPRWLFDSSNTPSDWSSKPTFHKLLDIINSTTTSGSISNAKSTAFIDAIMKTEVLKQAHKFLKDKGLFAGDFNSFEEYLKTIWFGEYTRGIRSSGFKHVFLGEFKDGAPSGLHYWMNYHLEESNLKINYLGYTKLLKIGNKRTCLVELPLKREKEFKNTNTMTTCSSPALDIALYTICFLARPNAECQVQAGPKFHPSHKIPESSSYTTLYTIQTYQLKKNNKIYVGTAYPMIPK